MHKSNKKRGLLFWSHLLILSLSVFLRLQVGVETTCSVTHSRLIYQPTLQIGWKKVSWGCLASHIIDHDPLKICGSLRLLMFNKSHLDLLLKSILIKMTQILPQNQIVHSYKHSHSPPYLIVLCTFSFGCKTYKTNMSSSPFLIILNVNSLTGTSMVSYQMYAICG